MPLPLAMIAGGAALGGIAGAMKKGKSREISELERQSQQYSQQSLGAFANLVGQGPGQADYTKGVQSQRDLASLLQGYQSSGLYDMGAGNNIAKQAFAGQRRALSQAFQDQIQEASRSAQMAGRSSNDPILRAKLAQEQMRQSAQLDANEGASAIDFGRQFSMDRIQNASSATSVLSGLGNQALSNQQSLFMMGQSSLQGERQSSLQNAQYEQSRGGGWQGAMTGLIAGAGAGMQMAQGFGASGGGSMMNSVAQGAAQGMGQASAQSFFAGPNPYSTNGPSPMAAPTFAQQQRPAATLFGPQGNPNNFAMYQQRGQNGGF